MASQEEIRARTEFCVHHLENGVDISSVIFLTVRQYDVSQRTAYRYAKAAEALIDKEDDALSEEEKSPDALHNSLVVTCQKKLLEAMMEGDTKAVSALTNALDKLKKQSGYGLSMEKGAALQHFKED